MNAFASLFVSGVVAIAGSTKVEPATSMDVSPHSGYVPMRMEGYVNDQQSAEFPSARIKVNGIPFHLTNRPDRNNLFLKGVGWSDWKKDPSSFYAAYDISPQKDPNRIILHLPVDDYVAVHLLAFSEDEPSYSNTVSIRMGAIGASDWVRDQIVYHDFSTTVPRRGDESTDVPALTIGNSRVFLVRLPIGKAIAQDLAGRRAIDVDVTKELRLAIRRPDPNRFRVRPLGLPSGVHIFAMTFERAPVQMEVTSKEVANLFNEPQIPIFQVTVRKVPLGGASACSVEVIATDFAGNVTTSVTDQVSLPATGTHVFSIPVPVQFRGYHDLQVRLKVNDKVVLTRYTTFALLPPNTRKYRAKSPFGVRDRSGAHFTPDAGKVLGPIYTKAGLRYGMYGKAEVMRRYGVLDGNDRSFKSGASVTNYAQTVRQNRSLEMPARALIYHEDKISGTHHRRPPDFFTGWPQYRMTDEEEKKFKDLWDGAEGAGQALKTLFPRTEVYFGNGSNTTFEEFLRRGFSSELMGSRGCEPPVFMRIPEAQPLDYNALNASVWMDRTMLDGYGYPQTPVRVCQEICFPSTNPGNLTPRTQAEYYVRHLMHLLVWEMPVIRPNWIVDAGNTYWFGNWGSSGLCYAQPDIRPKPSYVACATTTLLLDGARFKRIVRTGSPVVYAVEFQRKGDDRYVTCLWTIRGTRPLRIRTAQPEPAIVTDIMGNETVVIFGDESSEVMISSSPLYVITTNAIEEIIPGMPVMAGRTEGERFTVSSLGEFADWQVQTQRNFELETYDYTCPRRKGDFQYTEVDAFDGEQDVLRVKPQLPMPGMVYLPMYSVLKHKRGVEIPGAPTQIGLMVHGNGGWGRVIFELEDASGQRWISIGAEQPGKPPRQWMAALMDDDEFEKLQTSNVCDANTDDVWQRSYVNFEGWRYIQLPLPGNYPGEGYHWPYSSQWRHDGDGVVKYPLRFKNLIITLPEKYLYLKEYREVERPEIYLKDLMVTYQRPHVAFAAE